MWGNWIDELLTSDLGAEPERFFFCENAIGSVCQATDEEGLVVEEYLYPDIYGKVEVNECEDEGESRTRTAVSGSGIGNRHLFQGREWDGEGGSYQFRHRAMAPATGRFVQHDPLWGILLDWLSPCGLRPDPRLNPYTGMMNAPTNSHDPTGLGVEGDKTGSWKTVEETIARLEADHPNEKAPKTAIRLQNAINEGRCGVRYVYTRRCGWIDLRHFLGAAIASYFVGTTSALVVGGATECTQVAARTGPLLSKADEDSRASAFSYEDGQSNKRGAHFGEDLRNATAVGSEKTKLSERLKAYLDVNCGDIVDPTPEMLNEVDEWNRQQKRSDSSPVLSGFVEAAPVGGSGTSDAPSTGK